MARRRALAGRAAQVRALVKALSPRVLALALVLARAEPRGRRARVRLAQPRARAERARVQRWVERYRPGTPRATRPRTAPGTAGHPWCARVIQTGIAAAASRDRATTSGLALKARQPRPRAARRTNAYRRHCGAAGWRAGGPRARPRTAAHRQSRTSRPSPPRARDWSSRRARRAPPRWAAGSALPARPAYRPGHPRRR